MRILLLGDINSSHLQRWACGLSRKNIKIGVWSLDAPLTDWYSEFGISVFYNEKKSHQKGIFGKAGYFFRHTEVKKAIRQFNPDIVHAHYASSYGMFGRKSRFHPFFISVWGSDLTEFPNSGKLASGILKRNLESADRVFGTSKMLCDELFDKWKIQAKQLAFGVDTGIFFPGKVNRYFDGKDMVIGTVKSLEPVYRIDLLIDAFATIQKKLNTLSLRLLIAGSGSLEEELKKRCEEKCLPGSFKFTGRIAYEDVPFIHREIDVFVNSSETESFGVAVLEASACGKPVVLSNSGGLKEVAVADKTGIFIQPGSFEELESALERLILDFRLREDLGSAGRKFVEETFGWNSILERMKKIYEETLK